MLTPIPILGFAAFIAFRIIECALGKDRPKMKGKTIQEKLSRKNVNTDINICFLIQQTAPFKMRFSKIFQ